nr:NAD(P)-dependent oxidoreductase [Argonema antarcticum]
MITFDTLPSPRTPQPNRPKRIFVTGASGCIGHYIAERLIQDTEHEVYLLVRDPGKVRFDCNARPGITIIKGDMRNIARFGKLLKTMDCAVLAATSWGGQQEVMDVNIYKTMQLLNLLDQELCQQVIYFSTASVLGRNNQILKEASQLGTDYIRSKSDFLTQVSRLPIYKRMTILFPTLVLGGDGQHPYSHLSSGLPGVTKLIKWIRFFKADASFHFIHGLDIAKVVGYLVDHPPSTKQPQHLVLGNPAVMLNQAVEEACAYLNQPILFRVTLYPWLANILIRVFKIQMAAWDRFCIEYRHFTYQNPVNPATFGLPVYCATFSDVLKSSGIPRQGETVQLENNYKLELDDQESRSEKELD